MEVGGRSKLRDTIRDQRQIMDGISYEAPSSLLCLLCL